MPFLYHRTFPNEDLSQESASGVRLALILESHHGNFKGIMAGGIYSGTGEFGRYTGDFCGVCIGGLFSTISGCLHGLSLAVANYVGEGLDGAQIGLVNYAGNLDHHSMQIGLINRIKEADNRSSIVQIGLWNEAGNRSIPLVNIRKAKQ
jgi:hypothetical protein